METTCYLAQLLYVCLELSSYLFRSHWVSSVFAFYSKALPSGFLDTGGNLLLLRLHAEPDPSASEPYMQAMHFSFALGALAIPLVMSALNNLTVSFITIAILLLVVFFNFTFVSLKFKDAKYAVPRKSGGGGEIKEVKL